MWKLIAQLKHQPEPTRKKIFVFLMAGFFIVVFGLYLFSIKNSIAYSLKEQAPAQVGLPGEFRLPGIKESIGANVKDILNVIRK
ncbi:hypothetical protein HY250_04250 [Candidatus Azambacteria bacterium]|nr:hypothetical protein [Candidatus Azambacteria bacterium]MBI3685589.1 hypothetical protein [Candidatus Azambacteria bacterium]